MNFFEVADFIKGLDSLVKTENAKVAVNGRLITINGFSLEAAPNKSFPALEATFSVTTYLTPPEQGVTGGRDAGQSWRCRAGGDDDRRGAMKWLKNGPELKLPELKVPAFLTDLYHDLRRPPAAAAGGAGPGRDRRRAVSSGRWLGGRSPTGEPGTDRRGCECARCRARAPDRGSGEPGLRDYRKRLAAREPTDPFEQRYTGPARAGNQLQGESSTTSTESAVPGGSTSTTTTAPTTTAAPESPSGDGGAPSGGAPSGGGGEPDLQLFTFAIDVKIKRTTNSADGGKDEGEPTTKEGVVPPAALPSAKTQVVTYMGISPKTRKPLLLVSDDVTAVFGEAKCISGSEFCQLLEVELGLPITFVYGPNDARYKINVLKVEPVATGHF